MFSREKQSLELQHFDIIDYGKAPVVIVNGGISRVEQIGSKVLFALWSKQTGIVDGAVVDLHEVVQNLIIPVTAVGPAIELTLQTLGPRAVWLANSPLLQRLLD
jgi:hypothetical protein